MKKNLSSAILRHGARLFACGLLLNGVPLCAQNAVYLSNGGPPPEGGAKVIVQASGAVGGGGAALMINGVDVGTILLKACDLNQDAKVTLAELKSVAATYFKQWDTNGDGNLSADELSAGLKTLFHAPPSGNAHAMAMINGVAVQVPVDQMPTPDKLVANRIMASADANQDGQLSLQELNDWLDKSFSQWDQNGNGALDASELNAAFGQLARPD